MQATGCVYLVGAGPGDPELLTMKAVRILKMADVVVYDRLVSPEILDLAPPGTTRISVGKQPAHHPIPQDEARIPIGAPAPIKLINPQMTKAAVQRKHEQWLKLVNSPGRDQFPRGAAGHGPATRPISKPE